MSIDVVSTTGLVKVPGTFASEAAQFVYNPNRSEIYGDVASWVVRQITELAPQYRAAGPVISKSCLETIALLKEAGWGAYTPQGIPLIARIEQAGSTLRVVSGKVNEAAGRFEPCTLAELSLAGGWKDSDRRLVLRVNKHSGLSMNPSGLYEIARRYEESVV